MESMRGRLLKCKRSRAVLDFITIGAAIENAAANYCVPPLSRS